MDDLFPAEWLLCVLDVLDGGKVVLVLLHGSDPRDVVKGNDLQAEVLVVANLLDFAEECIQVWGRDVVYVREEIGWCELCELVQFLRIFSQNALTPYMYAGLPRAREEMYTSE